MIKPNEDVIDRKNKDRRRNLKNIHGYQFELMFWNFSWFGPNFIDISRNFKIDLLLQYEGERLSKSKETDILLFLKTYIYS